MFLKEYDLPAMRRKFQGTQGIWMVDGVKTDASCYEINGSGANQEATLCFTDTDKSVTVIVCDTCYPLYHRIMSGYYETDDGWSWLYRKPVRVFNIGINHESHVMQRIQGYSTRPHLLAPLKKDIPLALKQGGAITRHIYVSPVGELYYRNILVGKYDKGIKLRKVQNYIGQEMDDAFRGYK